MNKPVIGILVYRNGLTFSEPTYFRDLTRAGERLGATAFLFSPQDIDVNSRTVTGFTPTSGNGWIRRTYSWPEVVIDRHRRSGQEYMKIRTSSLFLYANNRFTNKWNITRMFLQEDRLKQWMPETVEYSREQLRTMLKRHRLLYVKPGNGTGGSSIVRVQSADDGYTVLGRSRKLSKRRVKIKTLSGLANWLDHWTVDERIRGGNFMIQQGLDLELVPERVTDTRLLIQKNESGEWKVTGMGMRVGAPHSSTSNLHGGGKAVSFQEIADKQFGAEKAETIRQECEQLAFQVVQVIEERFGPMMEFGIDIGIDVEGRVWLIEVNPKPGRDIFKGMGNPSLYSKSVERPIQYAMYVAANKNRSNTNEGAMLLSKRRKRRRLQA
ncbi:MAG: YheC/YheD family protein [Gorillibacterium sp.]|nr:YheC/YheD family protein [Gorillibacterium sp.]